jgi:hypothetical protein
MSPDSGDPDPQHRRSLGMAGLVTGIAVPLLYAVIMVIVDTADGSGLSEELVRGGTVALLVVFPLSLLATFAIGLPLVKWLRNEGRLTGWRVCLAGAAAGAFILFVFVLVVFENFSFMVLALGAASGSAAGVIFTLVTNIRWRSVAR